MSHITPYIWKMTLCGQHVRNNRNDMSSCVRPCSSSSTIINSSSDAPPSAASTSSVVSDGDSSKCSQRCLCARPTKLKWPPRAVNHKPHLFKKSSVNQMSLIRRLAGCRDEVQGVALGHRLRHAGSDESGERGGQGPARFVESCKVTVFVLADTIPPEINSNDFGGFWN